MTVLTSLTRKAFVAVLAVMTSLNVMAHPWENLGIDKDAQLRGGYTLKGRVDFFGARLYTGDAWVAAFAQKSDGSFNTIPCAVKEINSKGNASLVIRKRLPFTVKLEVWDCNAKRTYSATDVVSFSEDSQSNDDEVITVTGTTPTYQVVFDLNGEDGGSGTRTGGGSLTQTVSRLSAAVAPTVKAQAGYEFVTWDSDFSSVKKPMTVRAAYRIAEVRDATVTFDANGGTVSPATKTVLKGEAVGNLPEPDWPLCIFGGWFTSLNGGTRVTADTVVSGDVTYYAYWTPRPVTVTFDANGGTVSPATRTVDMGAALGGSLPMPTRSGHTFGGWFTSAEGGDPVTAETIVSSSVTYYAHWTAIMKTVTFNANGGTVEPITRSVAVGQAVLFLPDPSRRGYTFAGWWTAATGGTRVTTETVVSADVTYYAHWTAVTVQVTFDANGGTVTPSTQTVSVYSAIGDKLPTPTRSGHSFAGWWTAAEGGAPVTAATVVSAAATYYAHWTVITRTVTFNANGGTVEPASLTLTQGSLIGELPTPTRDGCVFVGWFTAESGGTQISADMVVSANVTFYAQYVAEVTFNANGGTLAANATNRTVAVDSKLGFLPSSPTRSGYAFDGWYTAATGGTRVTTATVVSGNATYYAHWTVKEYVTVAFDANGGTLSADATNRTVVAGSKIGALPSGPTRSGYTFAGWYTSASGGTQILITTVVSSSVTYYAHWTQNAENDLAFYVPTSAGWTSSLWLSTADDADGAVVMSEFTTNDTIYCRYAYEDVHNNVVGVHTNYVAVYRRVKWVASTFDLDEYEYVAGLVQGVSGLVADKYVARGVTMQPGLLDAGEYAMIVWLDCEEQIAETDEYNNIEIKTFTVIVPNVTVTFNANGGTTSETTRTMELGSAIGSLPTPTRSGYAFDGWYTSATGGTKIATSTTVLGDTTYYAHWSVKTTATVTLDANGGSYNGYYTREPKIGTCLSSLPLAWHPSLLFAGWYTAKEGGVQFTTSSAVYDDMTLYARWVENADSVVVTLDANGGWVSGGKKHAIAKGSVIGQFNYAYRSGYMLDGWFTESDGGTSVDASAPVYSNVTWYAHWTRLSSTTPQFTFEFYRLWGDSTLVVDNPNSAYSGMGGKSQFASTETVYALYSFKGRNYSQDSSTTGSVQIVLLYRQKGVSGQFDIGDYEIKNVRSRRYSLEHWYTLWETYPAHSLEPGDYAVYVILNNDKGIDADGDFKTQLEQFGEGVYWKMKQFTVTAAPVTVTFDANGGTVSEGTRTVSSGAAVGSLPTPTWSGYAFDGWYTSATGGTKIATSTTVLGDTTYYARWSVKTTATVMFDANGGARSGGTNYSYRTAIGSLLSLPVAWHTNLLFAGWYTSKEGGVQLENAQYTRVYDDMTLYARWIEDADRVVVTLDGNGGVVYYGDRHAVAKGSGIAEFSYARRSGYVLDGWFTEPDGGTRVMASTPVYSNVTWYAHWTKSVSSTKPHLEFYFEEEWGDSMMVSDDSPSYRAVSRASFNTAEGIRVYHEYHWLNFNNGNNPTGLVQVVLLRNRQGTSRQFDVGDYEVKNVTSRLVSSNSIYKDFASYSKNLEPGDYAVYVILNHDKEIDAKSDFKTQMAQFGENVHWKMKQFTVEAAPVTVTFDACYSDATVSPATRTLAAWSKVGELPIPVRRNAAFKGWTTGRYNSGMSITSETVVKGSVTYYADFTWISADSADPKDDVAKGAVNWALKATPTKFDRSLRTDDPEDNFKIMGRDGALYDIALTFNAYQVGCDAVFSITNANGVAVCDVNGMPIDHVTSATQIVMPKTKTPYYLVVTHGTPEKRSGSYTISGHYADVGAIKFAKTSVSVKESAAYVDLTVNRTGKDGRVRVRYATADGTAKAGVDYVAQSGVLEWADGDKKAKKIRIPLIPDLVAVYDGVKSKAFSVTIAPFAAIERAADEAPAVIAGGDTCVITISETSKAGTTAETVYARQAAKRATVKTEDVPLESGTFYGLLQTDYGALTNGFPRLGSITFTASTAKVPTLSAKVSIAGKTYSFTGKGWDDGWDVGWGTLVNVMKVGKAVYTNELYVTVDSGSTTSDTDWLQESADVRLIMNVPDANGKGVQANVNYANLYAFYRNNAKIQAYLDVAQKFAGYYTMGLMGCNGGNGYLTMTVDNKGNAKIAGMLPDGTTKPSLSVKACGIREDSESANGYAMYIPVFQAKSPYCFGGEIRLYALRDENAPDGSGMKIVVDENWSFMEWYNDKDAFGSWFYNDVFGETGFEEGMWTCGGWYDKVINLQRHYLDHALSVGTTKVDEFPYEFLPGDNWSFVTAAQPDGFALAFENDKVVHDKRKVVKTNRQTDFAQSTNACNVSVKFTRATGVFTGGCSLWCEDEDGANRKELTGFKAYGVFVLNRQPDDGASCLPDSILAPGCLTKKVKYTLIDEDTNRKASVNWSFSVPFNVLGD